MNDPVPTSIDLAQEDNRVTGVDDLFEVIDAPAGSGGSEAELIADVVSRDYAYGFHTDLDTDLAPKGLNEDVIRFISAKKEEPEWLLEWRLTAFRHFLTMEEPNWAYVNMNPIDYQDMYYWAAPKPKGPAPESLDDIDPEVRAMFDKLGISLA